jgi:hypothetical protein
VEETVSMKNVPVGISITKESDHIIPSKNVRSIVMRRELIIGSVIQPRRSMERRL